MVKAAIYNSIKKLSNHEDVEFSLLMSKKGKVYVKTGMFGNINMRELVTYTATLYGASVQTNKTLKKKYPKHVIIADPDGHMILMTVDKNHVIVVRTTSADNLDEMMDKVESSRWTILTEL
ncbi:MAG: roadblock/LC7 domain-containing protein [Candidatus Saliniplasma sp.]